MVYFLGVDLGQMQDPTALAVLHRVQRFRDKTSLPGTPEYEREDPVVISKYQVRHLERMPLGTDYLDVVARVRTILQHPDLSGQTTLLVDATGVGRPVLDMMRRLGMAPIGVTKTGGQALSAVDTGYNVPKHDLVAALQILFQSGRLEISRRLRDAETFLAELQGFSMKISQRGHDTYEAVRDQVHDDLVIAAALCAWYAERIYGVEVLVHPEAVREDYDPLGRQWERR